MFDRLARAAKAVEDGIEKVTGRKDVFMKDETLGMITCCPTNIGTGQYGSGVTEGAFWGKGWTGSQRQVLKPRNK